MSVIVRLQNLPWAANAVDIRQYFHGLSIPEGGVHIVGGELGDAFIAFSTDEDARQAMLRDGGKIKEIAVKLYLSSRTEMQKIIDQARQQSLSMQQFMSMPTMTTLPVPVASIGVPNVPVPPVAMPNVQGMQVPLQNVQNVSAMVSNLGKQDSGAVVRPVTTGPDQADSKSVAGSVQSVKSDTEKDKKDKRRRRSRSPSRGSTNSRSDSRSRSRSSSRSRDRKSSRDRHYDRRRKRSRSRDRRRRRERSRSRERVSRDRRRDYNRPRDEGDENYQQQHRHNTSQRNNRFNHKPRSEFYNRDSQNQNSENKNNIQPGKDKSADRIPTHTNSIQRNNKDSQPDDKKDVAKPVLPSPNAGSNSSHEPAQVVHNVSSDFQSVPLPNSGLQNIPHQGFYGNFGPPGPMFNQGMNFNMGPYCGYTPMPPMPMNMGGAMESDRSMMHPVPNKNEFGSESSKSPMKHSHQEADDVPPDGVKKSRFNNELSQNKALPNNENMQSGGGNYDWYDNKYPYRKKDGRQDSGYQKPFQPDFNRNNKSNTLSRRIANTCVQINNVPVNVTHNDIAMFFRNIQIPAGNIKIVADEHGNKSGEIYVKLNHVGDKKKAICRSGCLLNNSIVTVLHIDDTEFESATDIDEFNKQYWSAEQDEVNSTDLNEDIKALDSDGVFNCIKLTGNFRFHPLFDSKQIIRPHIRSLCEQFKPNDVCVVKHRTQNRVVVFMKFESNVNAESSITFLSNIREGRPDMCTCSEEEFNEAKNHASIMDVQHFLTMAIGNPGSAREEKCDARVQIKSETDNSEEEASVETGASKVKTEVEEPEPDVKRSNKVLLPTPLMTQPIVMPNTNCIVIHKLHPQANDKDILNFFSDIGVVPTQIHIMLDSDGQQSGEAYCEFETNEEVLTASSKNNCDLGNCRVGVQPVLRHEMLNAIGMSVMTGPQGMGGPSPLQGVMPLFYNGPHGPPSLLSSKSVRMDYQGGNDWSRGGGGGGQHSPNFGKMNMPNERGAFRSGRGGRGRGEGDFSGRGRGRGDGDFSGRGRGRGEGIGGRGRGGGEGSYRGTRGDFRGNRGGGDGPRRRGGMRGGHMNADNNYERRGGNDYQRQPGSDSFGASNQNSVKQASITRPIQLEADSVREFGQPGCVVSVENVPYRAELNDILDFFHDFDLPAESVIRRYNDSGQVTGDARIAFKSPAEAKRAIKYMNNGSILGRRITLNLFK